MTGMNEDIRAEVLTNYHAVRHMLEEASAAAGRPADGTGLIAVSKNHPAAAVRPLLEVGHRVFGENRVQEAQGKWPALKAEFPGVELHLIGPLQTNKVRDAVALFDVIETLDRPKLAEALSREFKRQGRRLSCLIQVNTGREPQKAGIDPGALDDFIAECRDRWGIEPAGLMCIPPADQTPAPHFALLREAALRNGLGILSMGMSGDFAEAVRHGATHVRIGTAIFGERDYGRPTASRGA